MKFFDCCRSQRSTSFGLPSNPIIDYEAVKYPTEDCPVATSPRPILRRGAKYSTEALRNVVVRMKSERHLTSSRDINWMNKEVHAKPRDRIPPASWSRFPSHTLAQRSPMSAGTEDNVYPRDFAMTIHMTDVGGSLRNDRETRYSSKTLMRSMIYQSRSLESFDYGSPERGVRSSISVGGVLEYPELAILPSLEAIPLAKRTSSLYTVGHKPDASVGQPRGTVPDDDARLWSRMYDECLHRPVTMDETSTKDNTSGFLHPEDASRHSRQASSRPLSLGSSAEMRHSTLDFQKSLEEYELRTRDRLLQLGDGSLRRPSSVS
jgi:hypothetical protein